MADVRANDRRARQYSKSERIEVQRETIVYLERAPKRKFDSHVVKYGDGEADCEPSPRSSGSTRIQVSPADTLDAVAELIAECDGEKVGFLVMANDVNKGGGYLRGTNGQEEAVCRRTNLPLCFPKMDYPIPEYGSFYIAGAKIIREAESRGYAFLDRPIVADCVLSAAYHGPPTDAKDMLTDGYRERTRRKIHALLNAFLVNECLNVVLGAYGCGAFGNPAADIASLFAEALEGKYAGAFDRVVFAVMKEASGKNFRVFRDAFPAASPADD
eukprot:c12971_g1_i1.p1 GENE.c12971_g1_i1~~c12971_g1_i1.p1  ORF type:complete len:283 (+),score=37.99 c12971_g1_i1:35-850(+)